MLGIIKSSIATLFKWGLILIAAIIVVKLITAFIPSLSQDNLKKSISTANSTSTSKSFGESILKFFRSEYATDTKAITPKYIANPNYDNANSGTSFEYEQYGGETYGGADANYNTNSEWGVENNWGENKDTDWSSTDTNWSSESDTSWGEGQTKWSPLSPGWFGTSTKR